MSSMGTMDNVKTYIVTIKSSPNFYALHSMELWTKSK